MQALPAGGAMLAVAAPSEAEVADPGRPGVDVAAVNGPSSVVVSGDGGRGRELAEPCAGRGGGPGGCGCRHAFHSPLMDPMLAEFRAGRRRA